MMLWSFGNKPVSLVLRGLVLRGLVLRGLAIANGQTRGRWRD